jgi:hypothetical protein
MDRFLPVNAEQNWLNNVESTVYLVKVLWLTINWPPVTESFLPSIALPFIGWQICKFCANFWDKKTNTGNTYATFSYWYPRSKQVNCYYVMNFSGHKKKQQTTTKQPTVARINRKKYYFLRKNQKI